MKADSSNKNQVPASFIIDEIAKHLHDRSQLHSKEIKTRIVGLTPEEQKMVKREVKLRAIEEQEKSGVREKIIDWAKNPSNDVKIIIAFSGGKDSIALVLSALDMGFDKNNMELWHHDVDGDGEQLWDWKCTKSYCQAFADAFGIPILFSYAGGGITREIFRKGETIQPVYFQKEAGGKYFKKEPAPMSLKDGNGVPYTKEELEEKNTKYKFPAVSASLTTRWCSGIAKIDVMKKAINNSERLDNSNIIILTGERRAESTARSLYIEFEKYTSYSKKRKVISWRSIVGWSDEQVWNIMKKYKIQPHPCYELGWGRCSCQLCIFSSPDTWASTNQINPEKVKRIAEIESEINHTLYNEYEQAPDGFTKEGKPKFKKTDKKINIYGRVKKGKSIIGEEGRKRWEKEANGEFVSPIFVKEWKMPTGAFSNENCGAN